MIVNLSIDQITGDRENMRLTDKELWAIYTVVTGLYPNPTHTNIMTHGSLERQWINIRVGPCRISLQEFMDAGMLFGKSVNVISISIDGVIVMCDSTWVDPIIRDNLMGNMMLRAEEFAKLSQEKLIDDYVADVEARLQKRNVQTEILKRVMPRLRQAALEWNHEEIS